MRQKWRKILFLSLIFLFLISAPLIILYSQGIRFDFNRKRFTQTGAIFLKVVPKEVDVYLNGKYFKQTDFLWGTLRIKNLIPKKYFIELKKEGFFPWKKEVEVKEKLVTEFIQIVLFPKKTEFQKIDIKKRDFLALKEKKRFLSCKEIEKNLKFEKENNFSRNCKAFEIKNKIFLITENSVFLFDKETETLEKIIENQIGFDKKKNKIAIFTPHEIWILQEKGAEFLLRERREIKDLSFLNENYLVFLNGSNKIKIVETDLKGGLNLYEIGKIEAEKVAVDKERKILVLTKGGKIFSSQSLY